MPGGHVSYIEKNTWLFGGIVVVGYATYLVLLFAQSAGRPLEQTEYVIPMLGTIGGAIVAGILGGIVISIATRADRDNRGKPDVRDTEIEHAGERVGNSIVVIGALGALVLAWLEVDHFWIANEIYLAFVVSGLLGTMARLGLYRRGF
jgi:pantothenate kinase type III